MEQNLTTATEERIGPRHVSRDSNGEPFHDDSETIAIENGHIENLKDLGHRVDRANDMMMTRIYPNSSARARQRGKTAYFTVALAIVASVGVVFGLVALLLQTVVVRQYPNLNTAQSYDAFDNPYPDIIKATVPGVQGWYRSLDIDDDNNPLINGRRAWETQSSIHSPLKNTTPDNTSSTSCLENWFADIRTAFSTDETDPSLVKWILEDMGLSQSHTVVRHLQIYLDRPQPFFHLLNISEACLGRIPGLPNRLACTLRETMPWDPNDDQTRHVIQYGAHLALILEVLTQASRTDLAALNRVIRIMNTSQRHKKERMYDTHYQGAELIFLVAKYRGLSRSITNFGAAMAQNVGIMKRQFLQINILEAVLLDVHTGLTSNAKVGLALAATVTSDPHIEDHQIKWAGGKDWIDGYMTWNMAFVLRHIPRYIIGKLLIPSTVCSIDSDKNGDDWLLSRVLSLSLVLMLVPNMPDSSLGVSAQMGKHVTDFFATERANVQSRQSAAELLGYDNLNSLTIDSPADSDVEEMLYNLCGETCHDGSWSILSDSIPLARMSSEDFWVYLGMIFWITMVGTGLSLELWVWIFLLSPSIGGGGSSSSSSSSSSNESKAWSDLWQSRWYLAQFVFPLLVSAALAIHGNFLAMPLLVISVWKFGFPETWTYMYLGLFDTSESLAQRTENILNGVGLVIHHAAMALSIAMLLSGVISPERALLSPTFILVIQHWFIILKYLNQTAYVVIELVLEISFQWMVLSQFEYFSPNHWTTALIGATMLVAHWFFLIAASIEYCCARKRHTD